ncbi:hypothetical protein JNUCC0626_50020 (plasmid) [Lentzea sp. JNUCC 0626]|uniref:hypothetical protein n=1 Tax=Lentzea sp. JNUCC 0626 TaxID=3367513 RepID=UPI003748C34D
MNEWEQTQRDLAKDAVRATLPDDVAEAVIGCAAFGAVAGKLFNADKAGHTREDVLAALDPDDVEFAGRAHTPAAFLASLIDH